MRACVDCKHYRRHGWWKRVVLMEEAECRHEVVIEKTREYGNKVTGKPEEVIGWCSFQRSLSASDCAVSCGREGRLWEPKA